MRMIEKRKLAPRNAVLKSCALLLSAAMMVSCGDRAASDSAALPLVFDAGRATVSKLPYIIAYDQGLYEKYGLDVELRFRDSGSNDQSAIGLGFFTKMMRKFDISDSPDADIIASGLGPAVVDSTLNALGKDHLVAMASTDCVVRVHIIGREGITRLDQLKGGRIGVSSPGTTTDIVALMLAERMGWDPVQDISIMYNSNELEALRHNAVDAIVGSERSYAGAKREGLPILAATREWDEVLAGNSSRIQSGWLDDETNREAARRFLKATIEGIAIFHQQPEIAFQVMEEWFGYRDIEFMRAVYAQGAWIPKTPYPCYDGLRRTAEFYDSAAMRRTTPEDFFDDSIMRELDQSGFIDALYQ
jgi:ABC-type nitrate/sulfonate/bicarbonate transport system substrate-binding protein